MAKKNIIKNYIYNLAYQILVLLLPLITTPYISRVLGAENIGIYSYTISISAYFILFGSLGIALYGQREVAYNQKDKIKYSKTFWEIILLRVTTMLVSLLIFCFTFANISEYRMYYRILIIEIIGNCIDISWFFQGLEEFQKTVTRNMVVKLISVVCIFVFIKKPDDLLLYFIIYVLSILIGNVTLWLYLPKVLKKVKLKELQIWKHFKPTLALLIPQVAVQVYTLLDRTMIGAIITDKAEVGFYDQSQKIIKVILAVTTSLGTVMLPRVASKFAEGEKEEVARYMNKSFNMVFFLSFPMLFGLIAISESFVPVFFGEGYDKVVILMRIISPIILLIGLSNVTGTQYLLPTKRQREYTISVVCGAIVNFIMNMCLIWSYGAIGASIGTVIAEITVTSVQLYFVRNDFKIKDIFKVTKNYLISSLVMFLTCIVIEKFVDNNLISIALQVVLGALVYGICLVITRESFVLEMLEKLLHKKVRNKN